ncbi:helix-turn-helix domain-containing protein [Ralstonia pseudosolanacearum]|uniref:helix-turn-helix domain-containing protein n=1 Tax=Ralstonia pseudosolanacearum TaxID=1310165 RepID=UPI000E574FA6|nr:helix-turn-helix domain-containing protein [Ralstonia pseudosolanacearum]AXW10440.1 hypothetical protein CJO83_08140 [Ralstonia solanacearum]AXW33326.1 hypothetical protein CJO88_08180 [Ralstonia solanacearum]AXW43023.1 hypothetical protein CJO90_08135 [Ralstonia solanacearum]AXW48244.1 hypothetical protein CJO91_11415 [Ralstonia solanacearum]AXW66346.1 hypothetical protein CJO95_08140 [Ralstonia solanacearum]
MTYKTTSNREQMLDELAPTIGEAVRYRVQRTLDALQGDPMGSLLEGVVVQAEQAAINAVMAHVSGNQSLAAEHLGISRATLIRKLQAASPKTTTRRAA